MKGCWSRGWAKDPIGAELKRHPQDFVVSESLPFQLSGTGEHLFVQIEKTSLTTPDVARLLARVHGIELNDVGYAGMKDKHAVTTQWFSLRGVMDLDHQGLNVDGLRVLASMRHSQKLRRGQLAANSFEITLRGCEGTGTGAGVESQLESLRLRGAPNYFGQQRFGWDNLTEAERWLKRRRRSHTSKFKQGLYLSVLRSFLFNQVLAGRVVAGNWDQIIDGDVLHETDATGPMWGRGRSATQGQAAVLEQLALEPHREICEGLEYAGVTQGRRPLVLKAQAFSWEFESNGPSNADSNQLLTRFSLPPGGYATSFLGEIFEWRRSDGDDSKV
jgi:tRNA pseudouridine13 synthase